MVFLVLLQLEIQTLEPYPTGRAPGLKRIGIWIDLGQSGTARNGKELKRRQKSKMGLPQSIEIHTRKLLGLGSFVSQH